MRQTLKTSLWIILALFPSPPCSPSHAALTHADLPARRWGRCPACSSSPVTGRHFCLFPGIPSSARTPAIEARESATHNLSLRSSADPRSLPHPPEDTAPASLFPGPFSLGLLMHVQATHLTPGPPLLPQPVFPSSSDICTHGHTLDLVSLPVSTLLGNPISSSRGLTAISFLPFQLPPSSTVTLIFSTPTKPQTVRPMDLSLLPSLHSPLKFHEPLL